MPKKIFFLLVLFTSCFSLSAQNCNPVGQFSFMGELKSNSVQFFPWVTPPTFPNAQINTLNCSEKNQLLSKDKYQLIQKLIFSAEPALVVMQKNEDLNLPGGSRCVLDVVSAELIFASSWQVKPDPCEKNGLILVLFGNDKNALYLPKDQIKILSYREPASTKKILKKADK